jgi:hypothetical protein
MAASAIAWLAVVAISARHSRRGPGDTSARVPAARILDLSVFLWGLSYLLSAIDSRAAAARIFDLNVLGSTFPPAVLLDWLAATVATVGLGVLAARALRPRWYNAALVVASFAAILLLGEGIARTRALLAPETQGLPTYSEALWTRRHVTLNGSGYRDIEHAPGKPDTTRRLLVVGDSFTFGVGVAAIADRFGEQLAPRLGAATGERWEAINAGRPDTHTLQHLETLQGMVAYRPELVVLLYVFNDIDYLAQVTPRSGIMGQGGLLQKLHPVRLLFLNSYLFQELYVRWRKVAFGLGANAQPPDPYRDDSLIARHMEDLARFVSVASAAGAGAVVVPFDNQVGAGEQPRSRYDAFVRRAEALGVPVCGIAAAFANRDSAELRVNSLDGHPNELANRLAAEAAVSCLVPLAGRTKLGVR